jgi:hypothetical protein
MPMNEWITHYPGVQRLLQQPDDVLLGGTQEDDPEGEEGTRGRSQVTAARGMPTWRNVHGRLVCAGRIVRSEQQSQWHVSEDETFSFLVITITWQLEEGGEAIAVDFRYPHRFDVGDYLVIRDDGGWFTSDAETFEAMYHRVPERRPRDEPR